MTPLKKGRSEARPRADFRTRGRVRELFSVKSDIYPNHRSARNKNSSIGLLGRVTSPHPNHPKGANASDGPPGQRRSRNS
jgi:hypothetical protein